jgi:hypothetical protein
VFDLSFVLGGNSETVRHPRDVVPVSTCIICMRCYRFVVCLMTQIKFHYQVWFE